MRTFRSMLIAVPFIALAGLVGVLSLIIGQAK
jgi:hypothetical protein